MRDIELDFRRCLLPGDGEEFSRTVIVHAGVMFMALRPFLLAYQRIGIDALRVAQADESIQKTHIPILREKGEVFVPLWWLEQLFPLHADTIRSWSHLAAVQLTAQDAIDIALPPGL